MLKLEATQKASVHGSSFAISGCLEYWLRDFTADYEVRIICFEGVPSGNMHRTLLPSKPSSKQHALVSSIPWKMFKIRDYSDPSDHPENLNPS